jgi:hypothetical protein
MFFTGNSDMCVFGWLIFLKKYDMNWFCPAKGGGEWRDLVNTVTNILVP